MYDKKEIKYIKAMTPVHAGSGQDLGIVDMPIQRERHSNIPKIEASSLKGSIKSWIYRNTRFEENEDKITMLYEVFGSENGENNSSSRISFTDGKLLFFPIKSSSGIFKLITCPYILNRWVEDIKFEGKYTDLEVDLKIDIRDGQCICTDEKEKIFLEEYIFKKIADKKDILGKIKRINEKVVNNSIDMSKIVIINDSEYIDLVSMYTEVITRNKIDSETGVAQPGGLFTEEYLPVESILYFMVLSSPIFNEKKLDFSLDIMQYFNNEISDIFQVGGNATIGKGFVKILNKEGALVE